ncbi:MAG: hypothetical protein PQ612_01240 [Rickettsiales bacterium]|nr:hypothetical protein [Pseudomonadota bacterium]MDA0965459.1 hypothetical protein [Pseudomonadota bacterium]MDG4542783.1 hypothetical protein [Rickettsiales bacterium]MDG4544769.1 hypothetical protein [Rickettsiales bacterium]MDG4546891.1 hypothetical protein [Rickettsiales bacterium]
MKNNTYKRVVILSVALFFCSGFFNIFSSGWIKHIPQELKPTKVIYEVDGTHFFGPGGINDAFIVYKLSDEVVDKIQKEGLLYLENMSSTKDYKKLHDNYENNRKNEKMTSKEERKLRFAYWDNVRGLFKDWRASPVTEADDMWNKTRYRHYRKEIKGMSPEEAWAKYKKRVSDTNCVDVSVCSFYGDFKSVPYYFKEKNKSLEDINFIDEISSDYIKLIDKIIMSSGSYYGYGEYGALVISPEHKKMFLLYRH